MANITYPNGQELTSTALTVAQMNLILQVLALQMLGYDAWLDTVVTVINTNAVTVQNGALYSVDQEIWVAGVLPAGTVISEIDGNTLTVSNNALVSQTGALAVICQPLACAFVRLTWPTTGSPDWLVTQDVVFISGIETDDEWNKIRDQTGTETPDSDNTQITGTQTYQRVWRVEVEAYGPNSFDNLRAIRSGLFQDFVAFYLQSWKLATVTEYPAPVRAPQQFGGQWFEHVVFDFRMNELVTETLIVSTVASVSVSINTAAGEVAEVTISD